MFEIVVGVIAGIFAGVGTGFAGLSAAVFIAPMLIVFLELDSYTSIGIALASDVLASAISAATYAKNKNIDLKRGRTLMCSVLIATVIGSIAAYFFTSHSFGNSFMGYWLIAALLFMGTMFIVRANKQKQRKENVFPLPPGAVAILGGIYIGFTCGFQGTGGGLLMLFVLNVLLCFEFKTAVGTSVFIMSFTALIGAVSHFMINGIEEIKLLCLCVVVTLFSAQVAAIVANRIEAALLKRLTGILMVCAGTVMCVMKLSQ